MFSLYYDPQTKRIEESQDRKPDCGDGQVLVEVCAVNICGSDVHYFSHGRCGSYVIKNPLILGHEGSGRVVKVCSDKDSGLVQGGKIFINPYHFCGECKACREGRENFCQNGKFMGTASVYPHNHGLLRQYVSLPFKQCFAAPDHLAYEYLACAEPLSVVLHALKRANDISDKQIAVTGAGAIGLLTIMAARYKGAKSITAIDTKEFAKNKAIELGADESGDDKLLSSGLHDVIFETTGSPEVLYKSLSGARPGAVIVQIGTLAKELNFYGQNIVSREIDLRGSFRYTREFEEAVDMISKGQINLSSYVTHVFPGKEVNKAFDQAVDNAESSKISIRLGPAE